MVDKAKTKGKIIH